MSVTDVTVVTDSAVGNTKTTARARSWCFTLNNYTEEEYNTILTWSQCHSVKYIIGKEVGKEGTPHLQGYIYTKDATRFTTLKKINDRIHWEKAQGNADHNYRYCSKEKNFESNYKPKEDEKPLQEIIKEELLEEYKGIIWKPWQKAILDLIETKADSRSIVWVYDRIGNSGKSFLAKYIALSRTVIIADGKKDNVFNQVNDILNEQQKRFDVVFLDIPRSGENYINYGVIEQLKNGLLYSGKYKGGQCIFGNVHVIVFANFQPDMMQFSLDRWKIIDLEEIDEEGIWV